MQLSQDLMWYNINHLRYSNAKNENEKWDVLPLKNEEKSDSLLRSPERKPWHSFAVLLLIYLAFKYFDFECTWWMLFQKHVVSTKFYLQFAMQVPLRNSILFVYLLICLLINFIPIICQKQLISASKIDRCNDYRIKTNRSILDAIKQCYNWNCQKVPIDKK
jgi:hypothetical protein